MLLISAGYAISSTDTSTGGDAAIGERIYVEGRLANGEPLRATTQGDITFSATQFSCVSCHRRSGYGSSEGGVYVLPITAAYLYRPRQLNRSDLFKKMFLETQPVRFRARIRSPQMRPAYDDVSLAKAISAGVDSAGRELDPLMPRYHLDETNMQHMVAYLKTLSVNADPGVDEKAIYIATIIGEKADPDKRDAMLATIKTYTKWINRNTKADLWQPNFSPNFRTDLIRGYRYWRHKVWRLSGPQETWRSQLDEYYRQQPVFTLISGLVGRDESWQPVERFCEAVKLPCLFPHTELPALKKPFPVYSVYFNRGAALEGEVVARYLRNTAIENGLTHTSRAAQLSATTRLSARTPANALKHHLAEDSRWSLSRDDTFGDRLTFNDALESLGRQEVTLDALVIWPGADMDWIITSLKRHTQIAERIILPASALKFIPENMPSKLVSKLLFSYPYELPNVHLVAHPRRYTVNAWMHSKGLDLTEPRLQYNTYYALTILQSALMAIVDNFSRDYLLEFVEHEAENGLNLGTYPKLSLGPGQRFASRGAYMVRLDNNTDIEYDPNHIGDAGKRVSAVSAWIIP